MQTNLRRLLMGALAGAVFVQPVSVVAAPTAGAQLPDWDAAKRKPKPADLPDWDAAKPKDPKKDPKDGKATKPKKPRKPAEAPPTETPPAEAPPAETPVEAPPAETPVEAPPAEPTVQVRPPEPTPAPVVEGPKPAPAVDTGTSRDAQKAAKREIVAGAALLGLGVGGFGMMGAGFAMKGKDDATEEEYDRAVTILSAGAILGTIGTVMGLALLGEGIKDRRAARPKAQARVLPTFGGLAITGRF